MITLSANWYIIGNPVGSRMFWRKKDGSWDENRTLAERHSLDQAIYIVENSKGGWSEYIIVYERNK
jgi:hypothetical protein